MLTVSDALLDVEAALGRGELVCSGCSGRLAPWGWARSRLIRHGVRGRVVAVRPRRARCRGCGVTHVLLGVGFAARRADGAEVIGFAVEKKAAAGWGHRRIAEWLGRPVSTVRGWLRAWSVSARQITGWFMGLVVSTAPDAAAIWPAPSDGGGVGALAAVEAYAAGLGQRFGQIGTVAWVRAGIAATGGWLFCGGFWRARAQHELALPGLGAGREG